MKISIKILSCLFVVLLVCPSAWAQKPELVVQSGHSTWVSSVAFSPDGKMLASGGYDNIVVVWDISTRRQLRTFEHDWIVQSVCFSPDGKTLATAGADKTIRLWNLSTGNSRTLHLDEWVLSVAFSPDGKTLASGEGNNNLIRLWDLSKGTFIRLEGHSGWVKSVAFSPNGKMLASGSYDRTIRLWDVTTGKQKLTFPEQTRGVESVAFSPDGKTLASSDAKSDATSSDNSDATKIWDPETGQLKFSLPGGSPIAFSGDGSILANSSDGKSITLYDTSTRLLRGSLPGDLEELLAITFSPDKKTLASGSKERTIKLWDVSAPTEPQTLKSHARQINSVCFSNDAKTLASGSSDGTIKMWHLASATSFSTLPGHSQRVRAVAFDPNGRILASSSDDKTVKLWNVQSGELLKELEGGQPPLAFSPNGRTMASITIDGKIRLLDVSTLDEVKVMGTVVREVGSMVFSPLGSTLLIASDAQSGMFEILDVSTGATVLSRPGRSPVSFSPDGKILATGSGKNSIQLWNPLRGEKLEELPTHSENIRALAFSPDSKVLASGGDERTITLWDLSSRSSRKLTGHRRSVSSLAFVSNQTLASGSWDASVRLWNTNSHAEIVRLLALDEKDWAGVTPEGRFDASSGGRTLMHFLVGLEPIELEQLKERYYEPGLLAKLMGFNKEPLRDVGSLRDVKLFPAVEYQLAGDGSTKLDIKLTNRGGGIGQVQVFVNNKELIADARPSGFNPNQPQAVLTVDISGASAIQGQDNEIRVVARNQEGYLSSRGTEVVWRPTGTKETTPPDLYAIVVGTSTYAVPALGLRYAAKDAADMAKALELGGKRLFGDDRVHLQLLSTDKSNPRALAPTKANIRQAFEQVRKAKPRDIFVVYFAGHGVTLQQGNDTYLYLTQEARNTDSATLADPGVREQTTISSEELVEWIKRVPALKQVMMLDTCAAGAAAGKLVEQRNVSGDQIRALERLKDRTGFHVLMGSAADAVSYEASQYGQGVLTYALLQGMRGAALREDEYLDVQKLFQYAADEVPQLARNIGGLQRPVVAAPRGTSFDVGRLGSEEKALIPLTMIRPVILRPNLINAEEFGDTLNLMKELRKRLRDASAVMVRSGERELLVVYVDQDELPGAIHPSGTYTVEGERVRVTMALWRDDQKIAALPVVEGTRNDVVGLIDRIMKTISDAITKPVI